MPVVRRRSAKCAGSSYASSVPDVPEGPPQPGVPEGRAVLLPFRLRQISFIKWRAPSRLADLYWLVVRYKVLLNDGCSKSLGKYSCTRLVLLLLPIIFSLQHLPDHAFPNKNYIPKN